MTPEQAYGTLVAIAAELARGDGLPSDFAEDYGRKTLSARVVARMMTKAHDANRLRAIKVRQAADALRAMLPADKP